MFQLRYNVSSQRAPPSFEIEGLEPGASYRLNMYAVNGKGRSDPAAIETVVFKGQAKFVGEYRVQCVIALFESCAKLWRFADLSAGIICWVLTRLLCFICISMCYKTARREFIMERGGKCSYIAIYTNM